jgi:hypothetical protein
MCHSTLLVLGTDIVYGTGVSIVEQSPLTWDICNHRRYGTSSMTLPDLCEDVVAAVPVLQLITLVDVYGPQRVRCHVASIPVHDFWGTCTPVERISFKL